MKSAQNFKVTDSNKGVAISNEWHDGDTKGADNMFKKITQILKRGKDNRKCIDLAHVNRTWVFIEKEGEVIKNVSMAFSKCASDDENFASFGKEFTAVP